MVHDDSLVSTHLLDLFVVKGECSLGSDKRIRVHRSSERKLASDVSRVRDGWRRTSHDLRPGMTSFWTIHFVGCKFFSVFGSFGIERSLSFLAGFFDLQAHASATAREPGVGEIGIYLVEVPQLCIVEQRTT